MNVFKETSLIIPTRGDVDLEQILAEMPFDDIVIWNNSERENLGAYARYAAIPEAKHELICSQDDDLIFRNWQKLLDVYEPGKVAVNYQEPWDIPWGGRGTIFHRDLPDQVFARYAEEFPMDDEFNVWYADGIFSLLTMEISIVIDLGYEDLPIGFQAGRLSTSPGWYDVRRPEMHRRAELLKAAA